MSSSVPVSSVVLSRYAGALVDLAEDAKVVVKIEKDFAALKKMMSDSNDLRAVMTSQSISATQQMSVIKDICDKAKLQKLTHNFLGVLVENRRLSALEGMIESFSKIVAKRAGHVEVSVETAEKLSAAQEKEIKKKIETAIGAGVTIESKVTPEIIGGIIVTIGSYMVDDSVRRKIERLGVALKSNANQNTTQNLKEVV